MRTTMNLTDEAYLQLKHLALTAGRPMGDVASELIEKALKVMPRVKKQSNNDFVVPRLPKKKGNRQVVTNEFINMLREQEGI